MISNKVVAITGAGKGIGRSIALKFAEHNNHLAINSQSFENTNKTKEEIEQKGISTVCHHGDISENANALMFIKKTIEKFGRIDILVNNAGISPKETIEEMSEESFDRVMRVNLKHTFICSKYALTHMKKQKWGRIINISSVSALNGGFVASAHYCASKAGIISLTKAIAREYAPYNITANAIAPGIIVTELFESIPDEIRRKRSELIPSNKEGEPSDVAAAALFLASEEAKYINGTVINVNGGLLMI